MNKTNDKKELLWDVKGNQTINKTNDKKELLWDVKGNQTINKSHIQRFKIEYQEISLNEPKFGVELLKSIENGYEKETADFIQAIKEKFLLYFSDYEIDALLEALKKDKEQRS